MERRLAAILAADVVGYSRLIREDEAGTLAALKAHREQLIAPKVAERKGRIVKLMGDGILVEFPSAVEAVQCAVEIQHLIGERNATVSEEKRITYRIGINIGDIVVEDDDIYGDGVNVAARLEGLAEPSGICVARNVFNQVKDKLDLTIEHLGEREVKNIAEPVTVYRVVLDDKAATLVTPVVQEATKPVNRRWVVAAAAAVVLVAAVGGVFWWQPWAPDVEPASVERMAFPLPDKPSIAVLPFTNMSDDPEQEYFADGMTEDLITDLSKISGLFVIARNSTFAYKGKTVTIRQVAEELGVRYVLEGSVRRAGDQVRINAQLIDATTGGHVWAEHYDGSLGDVFALQDRVRAKIVSALAVRLSQREELAVTWQETDSPEAYDRFLQGWQRYRERTPRAFAQALAYFTEAVERDPGYGRAYAALASIYWESWERGWHRSLGLTRRATRRKAEQHLERALEEPTALAHQVASEMHRQDRRFEQAIAEAEAGIALDPNDANGYVTLAGALIMVGRAREAADLTLKAMRLDPHYPAFYLYVLGVASYGDERYTEAAEYLARAAERNPENHALLIPLAAAYGQRGREKEAVGTMQRYVELRGWSAPPTVAEIVDGWPFQSERDRERLADGLRKAGLPED